MTPRGDLANPVVVHPQFCMREFSAGRQAFLAPLITLRNTGTNAWQGWAIRLRSIAPRTNSAWGTDYILIAQGTVVQPGSNHSFLCTSWAYPEGLESYPIVHAFHLRLPDLE